MKNLFDELDRINRRPEPFEEYTASDLWTDGHTSERMLAYHLNGDIDVSSRNAAFIDRSVEWIGSRFSIGEGTAVADFGCGPGLYATRLARRGARVTGIDFSRRSIEHARNVARQERLDIRYVHQNYLEFETGDRFDLILMIMCDFCALSPDQRKRMLGTFRRIVKPSGFVLLDVYSMNAFRRREESAVYEAGLFNGFWSPDRYYGFLNTFKYEEEKVILDKYTIFEAARVRTVYNWLQYFAKEDIDREFSTNGFRIADVHADVAGAPYDPDSDEFAITATPR